VGACESQVNSGHGRAWASGVWTAPRSRLDRGKAVRDAGLASGQGGSGGGAV